MLIPDSTPITVSGVTFQFTPIYRPSVSAGLARTLFGDRFEQLHEPWRKLFSTDAFRFQEGLAPEERAALSYQRLRLVNESLDSPEQLALDVERLAALHEWAGPVDPGLGTVASIHYNLFLGSLLDHDRRDLEEFRGLERTGTFLCTEADHGNAASQLETTATYDPLSRTFDLHTPHSGARKFMPNTSSTGGPKTAVVAARLITDGSTDRGVFLFLTPLSDPSGAPLPGVRIERLPQTATAPIDHCSTSFEHVRLPYAALLQADHGRLAPDGTFTSSIGSPRKRFLASIGRVTTGKLCMSAYSLGVARHAVTVAVRHAHNRQTSGVTGGTVPLFAHRSHAAPLIDALATIYAATLLHRTAVRQWAQATEAGRDDAERLVAVAKGWITWRAREVMTECRERCGAAGLFLGNGIAGQLVANEGTITAEGDNLVIWLKAGGEFLLGNFTPSKPSDIPATDRDLTDPAFLQSLLEGAERIWHHRARTRLRAAKPGNPLNRWNQAATPALKLVESHAGRLAAQALVDAAQQTCDPEAQDLLYSLHRLFALRRIAAQSGDLLAEGCLTADQVRQLPDLTEAAIDALSPHALTLAAGMGVSEDVLLDHPITRGGTGQLATC
ncbi:acyl-CoA dehydrogenase [Streptomyces sp. RGM 3693]|uniref:acyl-CoA dehydrogenase family protein n=1 Tax=Streptomyces sp. RGM 3693 TaxID=3413284 RepID=UPI003D2C56A6